MSALYGKTRIKIREDTKLENFPLYCPKCKCETLINVTQQKIFIIQEPDALDAEPMNLWKVTVYRLCFLYELKKQAHQIKKTVFWWAVCSCLNVFYTLQTHFWVWRDFICVGETL